MGASITLRELVRIDVAKELTMTGRIISGTEAASYGLVTQSVDDPLSHVERLAKEIAQRSPDALAGAKRLYQTAWVATPDETDCLHLESDLQRGLIASWNQLAASGRSALGFKVPYFKRRE